MLCECGLGFGGLRDDLVSFYLAPHLALLRDRFVSRIHNELILIDMISPSKRITFRTKRLSSTWQRTANKRKPTEFRHAFCYASIVGN